MRILYVPFEIRDEPKLKERHKKVDVLGVYCSGHDAKATEALLNKAECIEYGRCVVLVPSLMIRRSTSANRYKVVIVSW